MNKQQLIQFCKTFPDAVIDCPFSDNSIAVARHLANKKWFALITELHGELAVNVKCDPMRADFLREAFEGVIAAWHMNKVHWNTVFVNRVPQVELFDMIKHSHQLTGKSKGC